MAPQPEIDPAVLRDQTLPDRVDRGWRRLERALQGTPPPDQVVPRRLSFTLAAAVAGSIVGFAVHAQLANPNPQPQTVDLAPAKDHHAQTTYAAGMRAQQYILPGGARLHLGPGSIVDTVAQQAGGLTLRLVQGEATLNAAPVPAGSPVRTRLRVGSAQLATAGGSLVVKVQGDNASIRVLDGMVDVRSPDATSGAKHAWLGPRETARIPIRLTTASHSALKARRPSLNAGPDELATPPDIDAPAHQRGKAAWVTACENGDYTRAVELLGAVPPGDADSLDQVQSPALLMCISTGNEALKNSAAAVAVLERVVGEFSEDPYALAAASNLSRIHQVAGDHDKAQYYAKLLQTLSKGSLLSADALCNKIDVEAEAGHDDVVLRLSQTYRTQFPDGPCTDKLEQHIVAIEAKQRAAATEAAGGAAPVPAAPPEDHDSDDAYATDTE